MKLPVEYRRGVYNVLFLHREKTRIDLAAKTRQHQNEVETLTNEVTMLKGENSMLQVRRSQMFTTVCLYN